jgi:hypothetical protein
VPQQQSAPQVQNISQAATDMPPAPGSPIRIVNIHTTSDFSVPLKFDKALAPPRESCRAYLPEETPSGLDNRLKQFQAFQQADKQMRDDALAGL